jgi:hypothetical protein
MAPVLLEDKQIPRRTLSHDMESFFAVIIWIATIDYFDEAALQAKPLAMVMLGRKDPMDIVNAKEHWFKIPREFLRKIFAHFQPFYHEDRFITCLLKLRRILYGDIDDSEETGRADEEMGSADGEMGSADEEMGSADEKTGSADLMKEGLFRVCMKEIDDYLNEKKGVDEMQWIDSQAQASHIHLGES